MHAYADIMSCIQDNVHADEDLTLMRSFSMLAIARTTRRHVCLLNQEAYYVCLLPETWRNREFHSKLIGLVCCAHHAKTKRPCHLFDAEQWVRARFAQGTVRLPSSCLCD